MKKYRIFAFALALALLLTACGGGDVSEVGRQTGTCERFSEGQVDAAMDVVAAFFRKEFDGCKLLRLEYNEEKTQKEAYAWSENYGADAIVLISDFHVYDNAKTVTLEPDSTYKNYKWILTRTFLGWELQTWGYG